jgi:hypothetical protein
VGCLGPKNPTAAPLKLKTNMVAAELIDEESKIDISGDN